jgi:hypothetical protein
MIIKTFIFVLFYFSCSMRIHCQEMTMCYDQDMKGFIKDGQDYTLTLEDSKTGKLYLSFFEGFHYRIVICSGNIKKFKISLFDIEKKMLFSGDCDNYIKDIDLKFKSNIACIAEISIDNLPEYKPVFIIAVGFKESQTEK